MSKFHFFTPCESGPHVIPGVTFAPGAESALLVPKNDPGLLGLFWDLPSGISKPWIWSQKAMGICCSVAAVSLFSVAFLFQVRQLKGHANALVTVLVLSCRIGTWSQLGLEYQQSTVTICTEVTQLQKSSPAGSLLNLEECPESNQCRVQD